MLLEETWLDVIDRLWSTAEHLALRATLQVHYYETGVAGTALVGPTGQTCVLGVQAPTHKHNLRPQIRRDYPLNLSISISGGKETN